MLVKNTNPVMPGTQRDANTKGNTRSNKYAKEHEEERTSTVKTEMSSEKRRGVKTMPKKFFSLVTLLTTISLYISGLFPAITTKITPSPHTELISELKVTTFYNHSDSELPTQNRIGQYFNLIISTKYMHILQGLDTFWSDTNTQLTANATQQS